MARFNLFPTVTVRGNDNVAGLSAHSGDGLGTVVRRMMAPTPKAADAKRGHQADLLGRRNGGGCSNLGDWVDREQKRAYPTVTARDGIRSTDSYGGGDLTLTGAVRRYPTPTASDSDGGSSPSDKEPALRSGAQPLKEVIKGALNPLWVSWLMGWPIGWTSPDPLPEGEFEAWLVGDRWRSNPAFTGELSPVVEPRSVPGRGAQIKMLGNGQVPACAAAAVVLLWRRSIIGQEGLESSIKCSR